MSHLREFSMIEGDRTDLNLQLLRAQYAERVAEALYQASKLSKHAYLGDAPPAEPISHFRDIAESAVMMVCDESLRLSADYYATSCVCADEGLVLETLPVKERVRMVRNWRTGLGGWLRMLRGMYPAGFQKYRELAATDRAHIKAMAQARVAAFPRKAGA